MNRRAIKLIAASAYLLMSACVPCAKSETPPEPVKKPHVQRVPPAVPTTIDKGISHGSRDEEPQY